jgi:hypothetical protein
VPTPSGGNKLVELYGVINPTFVKQQGCRLALGGTYDVQTGVCTAGGKDVTEEALARGCPVISSNGQPRGAIDIGINATATASR